MSELNAGDWGVFKAYGDEMIVRRVIEVGEDRDGLIYGITTGREYVISEREHRDPVCVGFRARYLVRKALDSEIAREMAI